ncbi:hypothetical protein [Burkholderia ubonensis]|uniref:hypothetical protein n=1 Tax=Burkholderia ubonensis TaxID=101571 RepID=UPI0009B4A0DD|nr:hypothetical protein [Burkholderia ubonensis]
MNFKNIDALGQALGRAALNVLVQICPDVRNASKQHLEVACAAMCAKAPSVVDQLLADLEAVPWISKIAFENAALALAQEGVRVLRSTAS